MEIRFYAMTSGRLPVREHLSELSGERGDAVQCVLRDIERNGLEAAQGIARHIEGKLWELKFPADRVFYVVMTGPMMVLLHAYKKQGQKAPRRELDVARKRAKEVL